jgi:hypothetical protein
VDRRRCDQLSGGDINPGAPGFGNKTNWGPEGAIGFDWQPVGPMHVVGQFRYGTAQKSRPFAFSAASSGGTSASATGTQCLREDHWLVDFGIGRDFGLGAGKTMWTLGVRVADLRAKWTANGTFHATTATPATAGGVITTTNVFTGAFSAVQRTSFVGAGPRFGLQGEVPLGNQWSIDWLAGAAVLFGERNLQQNTTATATVTSTTAGVTTTTTATATLAQNSSDSRAIFNVDAQAGLSYWFNPNLKFTVGYRFDGYFRALKTLNSAGNVVDVDRFYNGPMVRLTSKF